MRVPGAHGLRGAATPPSSRIDEQYETDAGHVKRFGGATAGLIRDAKRTVATPADPAAKFEAYEAAALKLAKAATDGWLDRGSAVEVLSDIAVAHGRFGKPAEAVEAVITQAMATAKTDPVASDVIDAHAPGVVLTRASDIEPQSVRWLWPGFLARGKMHLLGGAPSAGKTTIALALASTVSRGGQFPDGSRSPAGDVVIWSGEDDFADTIVPRLMASGADLKRIHFVEHVRDGTGNRAFDPARDMAKLGEIIQKLGGAALLIIDPVVSAVSGDAHKSNDVRRGLQPLVDMLGRGDIAAIGITHFSKGTAGRDPTERITGSIAFGALARIVLVAAKEEGSPAEGSPPLDRRLFTRAKSNIGPDGGGFAYRVEQVDLPGGITTTRTVWCDPLDGTARDILGQAEKLEPGDSGGAALSEACDFLRTELGNGPVAVRELNRRATDAGITTATLRRASERVGIKKEKSGFGSDGAWYATLPDDPALRCSSDPKMLNPQSLSTLVNDEHLRHSEPSEAA